MKGSLNELLEAFASIDGDGTVDIVEEGRGSKTEECLITISRSVLFLELPCKSLSADGYCGKNVVLSASVLQ